MRRVLHRLTAREVETAKKPGLIADGGGLYLRVDPSGAKRWTFIYVLAERRRELGLGAFPSVSLRDARERARSAHASIKSGRDPVADRRSGRIGENSHQSRETSRPAALNITKGG